MHLDKPVFHVTSAILLDSLKIGTAQALKGHGPYATREKIQSFGQGMPERHVLTLVFWQKKVSEASFSESIY